MSARVEIDPGRLKGLLLVALLAAAQASCRRHEPAPASSEAAPSRQKPAAEAGPAPPTPEGFIGVLLAGETVDLAPQFEAPVTAIHVRLGDRVEKGARLATLDSSVVKRELAMANAALKAALARRAKSRVAREQAKQRAARRERLPGAVSEEDLEASRFGLRGASAELEITSAQVAEQRARVQQLSERVSSADVRAPFAGYIALRYLDRGATARPGQPIVRLISTGGYRVRFAIPPDQSAAVTTGRNFRARFAAPPLELQGTITHAAREIDSATQMLFVEGSLNVAEGTRPSLRSGLVVRVFL